MFDATQLKLPPHSIEAEQAIIGGLLLDNAAWEDIADKVMLEDFYRHDHQLLFKAIKELVEHGNPFDVITLSQHLERLNILQEVGGLACIGEIVRNTPNANNILAYAEIVREQALLRQLIHTCNEINNYAFNPKGQRSHEILDFAEKKIFQIGDLRNKENSGFNSIKSLVADVIDRIDVLFNSKEQYTGIPTGFKEFDDLTSGLQKADLVIIAGRPSMGKTTFAMNIVENTAIKAKIPVAVFSLEMPGSSLAMRMMSSLGGINQQRVRSGKLEDEDWPRLTSAVNLLSEANIFIDDTPSLSPSEVRARVRRLKRKHDIGLVVIDYLQLMQVSNSENRVNEISEISRSLKALAKEMDVPVVALSQLNRTLEQRTNKRPLMSDLRESGAIEQDADLIVFIYRDEVYNEESPDKGVAEIIIGKQRNGPLGTAKLSFLGQYTCFGNLTQNYEGGDDGVGD